MWYYKHAYLANRDPAQSTADCQGFFISVGFVGFVGLSQLNSVNCRNSFPAHKSKKCNMRRFAATVSASLGFGLRFIGYHARVLKCDRFYKPLKDGASVRYSTLNKLYDAPVNHFY